jgi:Fe-S-cluster containining protein
LKKLPLLIERAVREAEVDRGDLAMRHEQKLQAGDRVTCKKGCPFCCYYPVMISVLEGLSIYRKLAEQRVWSSLLRKRFEQHSAKTVNLPPAVWFLSMIPCPLLHNDECQAYEARPVTCKAAHSTGDPYYCHPHRLSPGTAFGKQRELGERLFKAEDAILKRLDLTNFQMSLSTAVLYAEKVNKGELDIEDIGHDLWQRFKEEG